MRSGWFRLVYRVVGLLLLIALGGWIGQQITRDPGYVLVVFSGWSVETSLWIAGLLFLISFAGFYLLLRLFANRRLDLQFRHWRAEQKSRQSIKRLREGLSSLARGQFRKAHRHFLRSASHAELPYLNHLLAALSAHAEGREQECDRCLTLAEQVPGSDAVLTGLMQSMVQVQRQDFEQALATLKRIKGEEKNPFYLELQRKVFETLRDWEQLERVLKGQEKNGLLSDRTLSSEKALAAERIKSVSADQLVTFWRALPNKLKHQEELVMAYVNRLEQLNKIDDAEHALHQSLDQKFTPSLVERYGTLSADPHKQLVTAERWLKQRPNDAALLLTLGRLSLANKLWGKAQEFLELSISIKPDPQAHALLARYYAAKKDAVKSQYHFQQGLQLLYPLRELPMPEGDEAIASVTYKAGV